MQKRLRHWLRGDKATTLSILRDLTHAHISFKRLAEETGYGEKALHRMLGKNGNPTSDSLACIIHTVESDLDLSVEVKVQPINPIKRRVKQKRPETVPAYA